MSKLWSLCGGRVGVAVVAALLVAACGGGGGGGGGAQVPPPSQGAADTTPDAFSFAPAVGAAAGAMALSAEVVVLGINAPTTVQVTGGAYRIDNGTFTSAPGKLVAGARLMLQLQASLDAGGKSSMLVSVGGVDAIFEVATNGAVVASKQVPSTQFPALAALLPTLVPGDIVDVRPLANGQPYGPIKFTKAGTPQQPIILRGVRDNNGQLPRIQGFDDAVLGAIKFQGSHHMVLDSFEITNGANALSGASQADRDKALYCIANQAHEVTIRNSRVFNCLNHGILGQDEGSGSLTLDRVEVTTSGCDEDKGMTCARDEHGDSDYKHPVYVATDPEEHDGAVFRVLNSYLHDNIAGETIKSRSQRAEIRGNWIESKGKQDRALGLYGYEPFEASLIKPIHHDVVGNILVVEGGSSMARFGGDGTGSTFGRTRFVNNTVLLDASYGELNASRPVIRLDGQLEAFIAYNNIFQVGGGAAERKVVLVRENDNLQWATGQPKVLLSHNHVPEHSVVLRLKGDNGAAFVIAQATPPGYLIGSWARAASPGFVLDTTLAAPDLKLKVDSLLRDPSRVGTSVTNVTFDVPGALQQPTHNPVTVAPGFIGLGAARSDANAKPVLGAYD